MLRKRFDKLNAALSPLGFGIMRLPMNKENWFDQGVFDLLDRSMELGINYYDTGFYYQNERSEELIREALVKRYNRDSFFVADKLPVWDCNSTGDMESIFEEQLRRLGTETIDFYLLHAINKDRWSSIYEKGVLDFLEKRRRSGQIKNVGFSYHDSAENIGPVLDLYDWDFAQLQLNYYDWKVLHVDRIYGMLSEKDIPCITMETVGGGRLSVLPSEAQEVLSDIHEEWSPSSWAMRFALSLDNVAVVLSGMNTEEQLEDNFRTCKNAESFTEVERAAVDSVVEILQSKGTVPCTACRYCVKDCPKGIDIPQVFKAVNDYRIFGKTDFFDISYNLLAGSARAEDCINCGRCKQQCPQKIDIPFQMKKIACFAFEREFGINGSVFEKKAWSDRPLICFGCGDYGHRIVRYLRLFGLDKVLFTDNNTNIWGGEFDGYPIITPSDAVKMVKDHNAGIIITVKNHYDEIKSQLLEEGIPERSFCSDLAGQEG